MVESDNEGDNGLNIARRTRSHLRIDDFVPDDNLDFPDVDMNLYQNPDSEGDTEYKKFLNQCYSEEISEDNDPEYIYNDDIFSHGWRFDLNEVNNFNEELPAVPAEPRRKFDMSSNPEFSKILNKQLRESIQLLTQTFLLTKNTKNMQGEAERSKAHLSSYMKVFENKTKPSNLKPALEIVENHPTPKNLINPIRLSWRPLQIPESIRNIIIDKPNIFIYPSLLPQVAFSNIPEKLTAKKPKINFTINEDKLLAYALNEFKSETSQYAFIASLLMTAKTKTQISNHIKNIKRSPGNENNPIKLYYANGELPDINIVEEESLPDSPQDIMNMDLDDLMAASSTISKSTPLLVNNSENNKNIKNIKLKKSMLNLMSHNFLLSNDLGDLMIHEFLNASQQKLSERNNFHLLQLLSQLMKTSKTVVTIYQEICLFLEKVKAPQEIHERIVLFLNLDQATKCGCSFSYLHWIRFFEFMQHVELYNDGVEVFEKKLTRLVDALQKDDSHKVKLAIANLINKHPFLKREFQSLSLDEKPHPSLFICEEDFDDITEPMNIGIEEENDNNNNNNNKYEHFQCKLSEEELSYASQACPCKCHSGQPSQHCCKCNLKFIKNRIYLVNNIKPILAEWSYTDKQTTSTPTAIAAPKPLELGSQKAKWTLEEDREILEFCRLKAEQNEETISFDTSTFEELVNNRGKVEGNGNFGNCKKSAREIAERFNQLMEMYKDEASSGVQ